MVKASFLSPERVFPCLLHLACWVRACLQQVTLELFETGVLCARKISREPSAKIWHSETLHSVRDLAEGRRIVTIQLGWAWSRSGMTAVTVSTLYNKFRHLSLVTSGQAPSAEAEGMKIAIEPREPTN